MPTTTEPQINPFLTVGPIVLPRIWLPQFIPHVTVPLRTLVLKAEHPEQDVKAPVELVYHATGNEHEGLYEYTFLGAHQKEHERTVELVQSPN